MLPLNYQVKFIVQDAESNCFLCPIEGDVGYTQWAHEAGRFDALDEAEDTAALHCFAGFFVTKVLG